MVIASPNNNNSANMEKIRDDIELPIIDLHSNRSEATNRIIKACEEFGFFKVINHSVPQEIITRMEEEAHQFFSRPEPDKKRAGPADPYGYGCRNIGLNGDEGEVEYLLLQTNPSSISQDSKYINSTDPNKFSCAVIGYVEAVRELACEILDMIGEGLLVGPHHSALLSGLIRDPESDSLLRINHYPSATSDHSIGFGEHTDPQILTLLRSNGVGGLQISLEDGVWAPVSTHPESAFCVNVGDVLKAMTNGRLKSVRHRVVVNSYDRRTSIGFFAAPRMDATISCLPRLVGPTTPPLYRSFTWAEYRKAMYALRLGDTRLNLFRLLPDGDDDDQTRD